MNLLENRLAVITGAASGIGEASANLFAENGAKVLAFDLDDSIIEKFKDNTDNIIFTTASRIIAGHNSNEVLLTNKINKKQGFFERFFNFFN